MNQTPNCENLQMSMMLLDSMNEVDSNMLAAAILGVDITEVYSPERVAKVAQKYGLRAGLTFAF